MSINFEALEQAFAPIEEIGQGELTFEAGATTITLRVILPSEEVEAQKFAAGSLEEDGEGGHTAVDYLDRLRLGILSHAVVAVGEHDFRNVEYVETGQKLDSGVPVKIARYKAIRKLIAKWTRSTLTAVFARFYDLAVKSDAEAEKSIEYEPASLQMEIERLQQRIDELKAAQEQQTLAEKTKFTDQIAAVARGEMPDALDEDEDQPEDPEGSTEWEGHSIDPSQAMSPVHRRQGPISPPEAMPPVPPPIPQGIQGIPQTRPEDPQPQRPIGPPTSSFLNTDDDESMNAALDIEHQRILERRRMAAQGRTPPSEGSALDAVHPRIHQPPHVQAAQVEQEVGVLRAAQQRAEEVGDMGGVPVFRMPSQELGTPKAPTPRRPVVNATRSAGGSKNPRFTAPKKP